MAHPLHDTARKAFLDKLGALGIEGGEYPPDRAARIADAPPPDQNTRGDASKAPDEHWNWSPARQVSNYGRVKGD